MAIDRYAVGAAAARKKIDEYLTKIPLMWQGVVGQEFTPEIRDSLAKDIAKAAIDAALAVPAQPAAPAPVAFPRKLES